jgi:SAM-dependent methyltransferase
MKKEFAKQYGDLESWHWWFRGRRRIIETILRRELMNSESRRILSVGCGPAGGLIWLIPFAGRRGKIVGLDIEPGHAQVSSKALGFVVGALEKAPLADASFDAVLALDVLEHLDDDGVGLSEAVRLVRPGGLLLITVPALPSLWGSQDVVSEHRRRYTRRTLSQLFEQVGLADYQVSYFNTFLFPLAAAVRWWRRAFRLSDSPRSDFEDNHPGLINETLTWIFSAERHLVNHAPMPIGVSLIVKCRRPLDGVAAAMIAAPIAANEHMSLC